MISQRYNEQMGNYLAKLAKASKPQTNADKLRAMTDEELASYLAHIDSPRRMPYSRWEMGEWLDWLKQEEGE